ncbi:MAG: VWA domain-containing protein [Nitriliruptorales bacterium]|nr:VWA domain-containing protein [Nitriliruptorales bacterium]
MDDTRPALLALVHLLRRAGVTVPTGQVLSFIDAAGALAPVDAIDLYYAGRSTLISHAADLPVYDAVFRALFIGGELAEANTTALVEQHVPAPADPDGGAAGDDDAPVGVGAVASEVELLRHRRFDQATVAELQAMRLLMAHITLSVPHRLTRRTQPVRRGRTPDLRRSLRGAIRTDGEMVRRAWRRRRSRPRPLVLVLDVSGSMAGYSRALLQFAFVARRPGGDVEVFAFGTRLTRITRDLAGRDVDRALAAAAERVADWEGGTRIGDSLATLNREHGRLGVLRGAVIVICSDGLERGDPEVLRAEMARLARFAHRVVWVNPLKGDSRYEPVQRGMAAALPSVDRLVAGHDLASLEEVGAVLAELGHRPN